MKPLYTFLFLLLSLTHLIAQTNTGNRIITAGSAMTEIVCALGHEIEIVATDRTSTYPAAMQALPSIGYRNGITAEGIISQNPTLIITEKGYVKEELSAQLKGSGIVLHELAPPLSFDETKSLIQAIGVILHEPEKAGALVARLEMAIKDVNTLLKKTTTKPTVIFIYARGEGTQMIAGKHTFSENLIRMAGGTPVLGDTEGFKPVNTEELIVANPDYILFGDTGLKSIGGVDGALKIQGIDQTTAGKKKNILALDMVMISNFGPRLPQAVKELTLLIHPEIK